jgi:hypothetical protein
LTKNVPTPGGQPSMRAAAAALIAALCAASDSRTLNLMDLKSFK